jgi:echinoderm microtubule-associated protein-like 1/2
VLSFETIGIWPESADGTDINTVAKSNDSEIMATGDDYGKVNLFSYPAMQPKVSYFFLNLIVLLLARRIQNYL